jgi:hypothetical protein
VTHDETIELGRVTFVGCPVRLLDQARQHAEALLREFAFIVNSGSETTELPRRLLHTVERVQKGAAGLNAGAERAIEEAIARGDKEIDFEVVMPTRLGRGAPQFAALLDEVDDYCRAGDLLTLETPVEVRAFQRWYLDEMTHQLDGARPTPWREWHDTGTTSRVTRS